MTTIVFIPGVACTEAVFKNIITAINAKVACYIADTYNFTTFTDMANDVLSSVNGDIIVIGFSMGGYCAMEAYRLHPQRIKGMVLFNTGSKPATQKQITQRQQLIRQSKLGRFIGASDSLINTLLGTPARTNQTLRELIKQMNQQCGREVFIRQQTCIINRIDPRPALKQSNIPILCVSGAEDVITPPELLKEVNTIADNSTYIEIAECGHMATIEYPNETQIMVKDWLKLNFCIDL